MAGRGNGPNGAQIVSRGVKIAAMASSANMPVDEKWANARLIAAAPELLEATKSAYHSFLEWDHESVSDFNLTLAIMRAAIAKAEGVEPQGFCPTSSEYSVVHCAKCGKPKSSPYVILAGPCCECGVDPENGTASSPNTPVEAKTK